MQSAMQLSIGNSIQPYTKRKWKKNGTPSIDILYIYIIGRQG